VATLVAVSSGLNPYNFVWTDVVLVGFVTAIIFRFGHSFFFGHRLYIQINYEYVSMDVSGYLYFVEFVK
jgi:hypothetical protein